MGGEDIALAPGGEIVWNEDLDLVSLAFRYWCCCWILMVWDLGFGRILNLMLLWDLDGCEIWVGVRNWY